MAKKPTTATATLVIETRSAVGTTGARAARRDGKIPGVLYGHGDAQAIQIDAKVFADLLHGGSRGKVVPATVDGKADSVFLRTIERDPISHHPIAADFQRITKGEAINATLAVHTTGVPLGVRDSGGVLEVLAHTIEVKGPSENIPDGITVDVENLNIHDHISAGDVKLPAGFTLVTTPDTVLVSIGASRTAAQAEADQTGPAPAVEPEVVGEKPADTAS
jgi:large subunit ribosomal protein L25